MPFFVPVLIGTAVGFVGKAVAQALIGNYLVKGFFGEPARPPASKSRTDSRRSSKELSSARLRTSCSEKEMKLYRRSESRQVEPRRLRRTESQPVSRDRSSSASGTPRHRQRHSTATTLLEKLYMYSPNQPSMDQLKSQQAMSVDLDTRMEPIRTGIVRRNYLTPS